MSPEHTQDYNSLSPERIGELEELWNEAFVVVQNSLYPEASGTATPVEVLEQFSQANFKREPLAKLLIGIAGPGAAGKGTLGNYLTKELGFPKVINSTTREKREGEKDGVDYYFVGSSEFSTEQNLGRLALSFYRPGRGMYGIRHDEITEKLSSSEIGCVAEENPANLMELFSNINSSDTQRVLLYILPEYPIVRNSLARLEQRQAKESDPIKRIVTPEIFESTLGGRQVEEFLSLTDLSEHPNITPIFVINANLEETKNKLASLFGEINGNI